MIARTFYSYAALCFLFMIWPVNAATSSLHTATTDTLKGNWRGYYLPINAREEFPAELYFWGEPKGNALGVIYFEYTGCMYELSDPERQADGAVRLSARPAIPGDRCYHDEVMLQHEGETLHWTLMSEYDAPRYNSGVTSRKQAGADFTALLAEHYEIHLKRQMKTTASPLENPIGWYFADKNGVYEIVEDPRYRHTKEWKLFQMRALHSVQTNTLLGKVVFQGGWSNLRQDFSWQALVYMPNLPRCSYFGKEHNSRQFMPVFVESGGEKVLVYKKTNRYNTKYTAPPKRCMNARVDPSSCRVLRCNKWLEEEDEAPFGYLTQTQAQAMQLHNASLQKPQL